MKYLLHVSLLFTVLFLFTGCDSQAVGQTMGKFMITAWFFIVLPVIALIIANANAIVGAVFFVVSETLTIYWFTSISQLDFIPTAIKIWEIGMSWF
jgi:hypothetical protein